MTQVRQIWISFAAPVELPDEDQQALLAIVGAICRRYEAAHPGRVMWPFGVGAMMTSNPFLAGDDEPLQFDETVLHVECAERADYRAKCARCGKPQGDHKGHISLPPAGDCEFEVGASPPSGGRT